MLADEQAALRRVADLVARGATPELVFTAVTEEIGRLIPVQYAGMGRYEAGEEISFIAGWAPPSGPAPMESRWLLGGRNLATLVFETGRPARMDVYANASGPIGVNARQLGIRSAVGTPILVEGRLWGVVIVGSTLEQPVPADAEVRLASFTGLVATAVANAESRAGLARLVEEQAALRRVATLVAHGARPEAVFAAVVEEVGRLLPVEYAHLGRYEPDGTLTFVAAWGKEGPVFPVGTRVTLEGTSLARTIFETGRPSRLDTWADAAGPLADALRARGVRWSVGSPILVEGWLWGVMAAGSMVDQHLLPDTDSRLAEFTELVATAISNAESRAALAASRARVVAAGDEARRRIERDLHDGAQQRLVHAVIELKLALRSLSQTDSSAAAMVADALRNAEQANAELRELAHGIMPAVLIHGGLHAGVTALVSRMSLPVSIDASVGRLPASVEATAYFVISEALTNVIKHARAENVAVTACVVRGQLRVEVRDDGVGGADTGKGLGLVGLSDRVEAVGGTLHLTSAPGRGTTLVAAIPLEDGGTRKVA